MGKRKELIEKVAALTGAREEEIEKIYLALVYVIMNEMAGWDMRNA